MDADYFYYYGQVDQRSEIEADLLMGIVQPKRSLFYYRSFGAGVSDRENLPIGSFMDIMLKFDVASWVARRNAEVTDGSRGTRDRRAVTSQGAISVVRGNGEVELSVLYVPTFDYERPAELAVRMVR